MDDLNKALGDIDSIRRQMARSTEFRGYGPATLAATGALALLAAAVQAVWLPDPANHIETYLIIWVATAALSAAIIGAQMHARTRRMHSGMADEMIRMAVEQFLPSAGAGTLITAVLVVEVPSAHWLLPGLWQIIFSLGVFSIVPVLAAAHGHRWRVVSAHGVGMHCAWRQPRPVSVGHGNSVRRRPVAGRRHPLLEREGGPR